MGKERKSKKKACHSKKEVRNSSQLEVETLTKEKEDHEKKAAWTKEMKSKRKDGEAKSKSKDGDVECVDRSMDPNSTVKKVRRSPDLQCRRSVSFF